MKKSAFVLFLILSAACAEETSPKPPSLDNDIEGFCKAMLSHAPGVAVGIVHHGETKFYTYGTQNRSSHKAFDEFTIVEIGSITKTFNALLYADLALQGTVSLSDSANMYLSPAMHVPSQAGNSITLEDMLNHTSGLPREPANLDQQEPFAFSESQMSDYLKTISLLSQPGVHYEYSNTGAGLAGYMIKQITGESFSQRVQKKIFEPLGMNDTFCDNAEIPIGNVAQGYYSNIPVDFYEWSTVFASAGSIKSNMHDMLIYLDNAMYPEESVLNEAFELTETQTFEVTDNLKIGLGWHILILDGDEIIWHNGGTHGFHTFIAFNKTLQYGTVVFSNSYSIDDADLLAINILRTLKKYQ